MPLNPIDYVNSPYHNNRKILSEEELSQLKLLREEELNRLAEKILNNVRAKASNKIFWDKTVKVSLTIIEEHVLL